MKYIIVLLFVFLISCDSRKDAEIRAYERRADSAYYHAGAEAAEMEYNSQFCEYKISDPYHIIYFDKIGKYGLMRYGAIGDEFFNCPGSCVSGFNVNWEDMCSKYSDTCELKRDFKSYVDIEAAREDKKKAFTYKKIN